MNAASTRAERSLPLDFLRISLCTGVVLYHYTPERPGIGPFMVIGFLILSGFLLGLAFERREALDSAHFYALKCKRFLPMLSVALFLGFLLRLRAGSTLPSVEEFSWGNFSIPLFMEYYNVPTWYMGVELLLLLAAPFFFFLYKLRNGILFFLIGSTMFAAFLFSQIPYEAKFGNGLYFSPIARCWQFTAGLLAAQLASGRYTGISALISESKAIQRAGGGITILLSTLYACLWLLLATFKQNNDLHWWNYTFSFDLLSVIFFLIFVPLLNHAKMQLFRDSASLISYVAGLTYPIYLLHVPVQQAVYQILYRTPYHEPLLLGIISAIVSITGAAILIKLQKKMFP